MAYSAQARLNMIKNQLEPAGVASEAVLSLMGTINREMFVPFEFAESAYLDEDIPLGHGRALMEPRVFAKLLEVLQVKPSDKVLDIGCGTGYSSAVLSRLAASVVAVESNGELAEVARRNLRELGSRVELFCTSLMGGYSLKAPYDIIFVNGSVELLGEEIPEQLAEGGRVVAVQSYENRPLSGESGVGQVVQWTRLAKELHRQVLFEAAVPVLDDFNTKATFEF